MTTEFIKLKRAEQTLESAKPQLNAKNIAISYNCSLKSKMSKARISKAVVIGMVRLHLQVVRHEYQN